MITLKDTGKYKAPNGEVVIFEYEFKAYSTIQDAVSSLGDSEVLALVNRMSKVDSRNTTSQTTQSANGHSKTKVMTPEQKVQAKAKRAVLSAMAKMLDSKGITSVEELEAELS